MSKVEVGTGSLIFEVALWILGILPGLIFLFMKINALAYLRKLQQKIQADASQIDNYLEQRVVILQNVVGLVEKSIDLDKDVMKTVAAGKVPHRICNVMKLLSNLIVCFHELMSHLSHIPN